MKKIIRLTEDDLVRLVEKVISEQPIDFQIPTSQGFQDLVRKEFKVEPSKLKHTKLYNIPQNKKVKVNMEREKGGLNLIFPEVGEAMKIFLSNPNDYHAEKGFNPSEKNINELPEFKWFKGSVVRVGPKLTFEVDGLPEKFVYIAK